MAGCSSFDVVVCEGLATAAMSEPGFGVPVDSGFDLVLVAVRLSVDSCLVPLLLPSSTSVGVSSSPAAWRPGGRGDGALDGWWWRRGSWLVGLGLLGLGLGL